MIAYWKEKQLVPARDHRSIRCVELFDFNNFKFSRFKAMPQLVQRSLIQSYDIETYWT